MASVPCSIQLLLGPLNHYLILRTYNHFQYTVLQLVPPLSHTVAPLVLRPLLNGFLVISHHVLLNVVDWL